MYGYNHTKITFGGTHANYSYCLSNFFGSVTFFKIITKNEANILKNGGREYGQKNTQVLTLLHILFYLSCLVEAILRGQKF